MSRNNRNAQRSHAKHRRSMHSYNHPASASAKIVCAQGGKTGYVTKQDADRKISDIHSRENHATGRTLPNRSYLHEACGAWHVTSSPEYS